MLERHDRQAYRHRKRSKVPAIRLRLSLCDYCGYGGNSCLPCCQILTFGVFLQAINSLSLVGSQVPSQMDGIIIPHR